MTRARWFVFGLAAIGSTLVWRTAQESQASAASPAVPMMFQVAAPSGSIRAAVVGHESREDDLPTIATSPNGTVWVAFLSFNGTRDDIALRAWSGNQWSNLHWVPATSGDSWLPQVAVDANNRVWVVWSQQERGNWDLYARRFDPAAQDWGPLERLTDDPQPDINPRLWSDGKGRAALVWQGFRGGHSNIFLRSLQGEGWLPEVRVTHRAATDWEPAVALDSTGDAWVAYDTYKNGNYDVFLSRVRGGRVAGPELAVAETARFEARPTVAVDTLDRVWVAWEAGPADWGKDSGFILLKQRPEVHLGGRREVRIGCYNGGEWREPERPLSSVYKGNTYQPHVFSDGRGSIWVIAAPRQAGPRRAVFPFQPGYWEYQAARLEGAGWTKPVPLPQSKGRSGTRVSASLGAGGELWMAWPTDNRGPAYYHRPVRQQVLAGHISAPAPAQVTLTMLKQGRVESRPAHRNEAADVQAIRAHITRVGGKSLRILRGDFHRHTELSWDEGGAEDGSVQDFFRYMIDAAAFDFGAMTDHQGGAWPYWWWYTQKMADMYHVPGRYVPVFGYERSASFPFGHRNMFFAKRSDARVTPFFLKEGVKIYQQPLGPEGDEPADETGELVRGDTRLLFEEVRRQNGVSIPHTSGMTNFGTDWADNDPSLEPVVEIFQGCRLSSEAPGAPYAYSPADPRFGRTYNEQGMVVNAWAKGYRLGVIASSDHNSAHISYAMVYTDDPTREGILNAIRRRHTYGATDNILLDVRMGDHMMGDEFALARPVPIEIQARGTGPVAKVEVIKDGKVIYAREPGQQHVKLAFTDTGSVAGPHYYYVRLQQADGMIAWSSPMFVNPGSR